MPTAVFRGSRADLHRLLAAVPGLLAGRTPDPGGYARGFQLRLATALLSQVQQDFLTKARGGTGKDGVKWKPLSPYTIARRKRTAAEKRDFRRLKKANPRLTALAYYGSREVEILRDTTRLFRSLTPGVEGGAPADNPDQVLKLGRGELIVGTNVPYGIVHQEGTDRIPARPFLPTAGLPAAYWPAVQAAGLRGIARVVELLLAEGRG